MQKTILTLPEMKLAGMTVRTSNAKCSEQEPGNNDIARNVQAWFQQALAERIPHRRQPGTTLCVYTQYESDWQGEYTHFIGEAVTQLEGLPEGLTPLVIPPQRYLKLTSNPGPMPDICIAVWQTIWSMPPEALPGKRTYLADFEVYDERSKNPEHSIIDVYLGITEESSY